MKAQALQYVVIIALDRRKGRSIAAFIGSDWLSARNWLQSVLCPKQSRIKLGTWYRDELVGWAKIVKLKRAYKVT